MSIYATLWWLKFPRYGDEYIGGEWIRISAQGVTPHIGTPKHGRFGYEGGDPYAQFLPPAVTANAEGESEFMRAVVVTEETPKGTAHSPQEYVNPILVLSGREYASISFVELHTRICDALRASGPEVVAQSFTANGEVQLVLSDGRILDTRKIGRGVVKKD